MSELSSEVEFPPIDWTGFEFHLYRVLTFQPADEEPRYGADIRYAVDIRRSSITKSGNRGKGKRIVLVVGDPGQDPYHLLRSVTEMMERGKVKIGNRSRKIKKEVV